MRRARFAPPALRGRRKICAKYTAWDFLEIINLMEVFKTRLRVKDGGLVLPQEPGHGVVLDEAAVERFSDGWR